MRRTALFSVCLLISLTLFAQKEKGKNSKKTNEVVAEKALPSTHFGGLSFRSIGPAVTSGRIADFAVNPSNHSEYYVASASGLSLIHISEPTRPY